MAGNDMGYMWEPNSGSINAVLETGEKLIDTLLTFRLVCLRQFVAGMHTPHRACRKCPAIGVTKLETDTFDFDILEAGIGKQLPDLINVM